MRRKLFLVFAYTFLFLSGNSQEFDRFFKDKTLRIDYVFSGDANNQSVFVNELVELPGWYGRRDHLSELPLEGIGQIKMRDKASGEVIYCTSFATLFQEWLSTDEAKNTPRSFENVYLLPYPKQSAEVTVTLFNEKKKCLTSMTHEVSPNDILIRKISESHITPNKYLLKSGETKDCVDIAILAEGYTKSEMNLFYTDAQAVAESLFEHEPFGRLKDKFNIIAVESSSEDSGVSIPGEGTWKKTVFGSHFSTFYSDRYLTSNRVKKVHNVLEGIPYEYIIILANTEQYGGGGIYNAFTLTTAHHKDFKPVVVHEFGHSFGGLADEYYYEEDLFSNLYPLNKEPWEQNITTLIDFQSKWQDMLPENTSIPTDPKWQEQFPVGVYEGGGYSAKGIYRPSANCRMKTNAADGFCPVCQRAIERLIGFYTNN